jgi:hypothetical protein
MSTVHPFHPMLHIIPCSKGMYHVYLNSGIDFNGELYDKMESLFEKNFGYRDEPLKWSREKCETTIRKMNEILQQHDPEEDYEDESGSDEEEDSDNEETIQQVLARRLKSESTKDIIEEDELENSEDEDVISLSRRIRYIYSKLKDKK